MFKWLKGGKKEMARNLVNENLEENKTEPEKAEGVKNEIQLVTTDAFIINRLTIIEKLLIDGFTQVGVKFKE